MPIACKWGEAHRHAPLGTRSTVCRVAWVPGPLCAAFAGVPGPCRACLGTQWVPGTCRVAAPASSSSLPSSDTSVP